MSSTAQRAAAASATRYQRVKRLEQGFRDAELDGRREQCIELLASGMTPASVRSKLKLNIDVVRRIRDEHPECMAALKNNVAKTLGEASQVLAQRLLNSAEKIPIEKVPAALSMAIDKYQLLSGGVTQRTEHRNIATPEDLEAMFNALPQAKATVIESKEAPNGDVRHD